ncbi:MAG: hypothetical protein ACLQAT_13850 [Candidatus Binataceae bacterium]
MNDPSELLADVMVSVAAYPRKHAEKMVNHSPFLGLSVGALPLDAGSLDVIRDLYSTNFKFSFDQGENEPAGHLYLSGALHYVKLRCALLWKFDL